MLPIETLSVFLAASVALALAPGPDNLFVLTQAALYGRAAGLLITLGLCSGLLVHTAAVVLGVAVVVRTSALAFTTLKLAGAAYLLYLAWQAVRARPAELPTSAESLRRSRLYLRGVIMNVTNPKVAIFFLAFLPQFADPKRGSVPVQLLLLGVGFLVAAGLTFSAIAWSAGFLGEWLRRSRRAPIIMNRVAAAVFVGLAVELAMSQR